MNRDEREAVRAALDRRAVDADEFTLRLVEVTRAVLAIDQPPDAREDDGRLRNVASALGSDGALLIERLEDTIRAL